MRIQQLAVTVLVLLLSIAGRAQFYGVNKVQYDDFEWRYEKCDVKSSPVSEDYPKVYPTSRLLVRDGTKKVDRFVFTKINLKDKVVLIAGCIKSHKFWDLAKPLIENAKHPCHYVLAKELSPFRDFIYAN